MNEGHSKTFRLQREDTEQVMGEVKTSELGVSQCKPSTIADVDAVLRCISFLSMIG